VPALSVRLRSEDLRVHAREDPVRKPVKIIGCFDFYDHFADEKRFKVR